MDEEAFIEAILNTMPLGMDIVDEHGTILKLNNKFLSLFGEKAIGQRCYAVYKDDKTQCLGCPLIHKVSIGDSKSMISSGVAGGRTFQIHHAGIRYQGKDCVLEIFDDITQIKRAEDALQEQNRELATFNSIAVDRELRMAEMKATIADLREQLANKA